MDSLLSNMEYNRHESIIGRNMEYNRQESIIGRNKKALLSYKGI